MAPGRPASAGDQRSTHKRRPRRYIGLRPRKIRPPVDGAPILGVGTRGTDWPVSPCSRREAATPSSAMRRAPLA